MDNFKRTSIFQFPYASVPSQLLELLHDRSLFIDPDRARVLLSNHPAQRKTPEFRILPCLGLLQNPDGGTRYDGFVFRNPHEGLEPFPFAFLKGLHKNFRSQNVVFFRNKTADALSTEQISLPYLIGFSYAGPDRPDKICGEDLNGTGKHVADEEDVRRHLLAGYRKPLPSKMGTIYASAVRRCLEGTFSPSAAIVDDGANDDDHDFVHEFWSTVIKELERCHT
ncbi:hypothetical protein GGTG_08428 [Gaeumannomyces tritici R3-111a-1]|uniref:Uncharacterized protein n=1 Tax=Gaeumannomyces tritici (strain R3-111a-1) TaxID=644352 RepID=J3P4J1_GAET3|nr:hypothetical protein GGTG_08428 [Gaeumannomyces tritici R3-111a-1]EJT74588.1 hypothetical protein GGTG_08428 [Gaeumannomyces tritici R3-111a-1]